MRTLIRHILGAVAAGVATWLSAHSGQEVSPEATTTIALAAYAVVEKSLKKVTKEE